MAINSDDVIMIAPELASEDPDRIDYFISIAALYVNASIWGAKADHAQALFTAHLLTMNASGGASGGGGLVSSERVGDLAISYAVESATTDSLGTTKYGSLFSQLRKTLLITPIVVC